MKTKTTPKLLSLLLAVIMTLGLLPVTAAAQDNVVQDITNEMLSITLYSDKYQINGNTNREYDYDTSCTITGSSSGHTITVHTDASYNGGKELQIILKNVNISNEYDSPFMICDSSKVVLTLSGENIITCNNNLSNDGTYAGLNVSSNAKITIKAETDAVNDSLTANGGKYGAGIGGERSSDGGDITISGGEITANGGKYSAGIGGGYQGGMGNITISGGSVTANGGDGGYCPGIGTSLYCRQDGGNITISGGKITANGGIYGVGIGSSLGALYGGNLSISGGTVTAANGGDTTYGINCADIEITGGSVYSINGDVSPQPTNGSANVYLNTLTVGSDANANTAVTAVSVDDLGYTYGINDVYTDSNGKVYFWLPETGGDELVTATVNGANYGYIYTRGTNNDDAQTLLAVYVVTFETSGGSSIAQQEKYNNQTADKPDDPTRSGYSFVGWYTDTGYTNEYDFTQTVIGNITLYAKWRANSTGSDITYYTLSFNTNGGTSIATLRRGSGTSIDLSTYTPTREGYNFTGWYSDEDLTTKVTSITMTKNITVYAGWEPEEEESTIHEPYLSGYSGTFRPDSSVTRAEVAQLLYNISGASGAGTNKFSDVSSDKWYYNAVTTLTDDGVISGYTDGSFRPDNEITRAEFVAMVVRYAGLSETTGNSFFDISPNHWAAGYIAAATQAGYISGYTDGSFRPDAAITRAEAVTVLNAMLGREVEKDVLTDLTMHFSDVSTTHWAYYQILEAAVKHEHKA